jgi:predicted transcriptional regulator
VNVTLTLDDELVKKVRKIAIDRDTTLTGLVRAYLQQLADEEAASALRQRQLEALERAFNLLKGTIGERTWTRADLYERS